MDPLSTYNSVNVSLMKATEILNTGVHYMDGDCSFP